MFGLILSLALTAAPAGNPAVEVVQVAQAPTYVWRQMPNGYRSYTLYQGDAQVGFVDDNGVFWVWQGGVWVETAPPIAYPAGVYVDPGYVAPSWRYNRGVIPLRRPFLRDRFIDRDRFFFERRRR